MPRPPIRDPAKRKRTPARRRVGGARRRLPRADWLQSLPAEQAALVPLLRELLQRAAGGHDAFMRHPAASLG